MPHSAPQDPPKAPRHERLFELLRQESLANERYAPPAPQEAELTAASVADFQHLAQASLAMGLRTR